MTEQLSLFDIAYPKYKITKPIRLIELFAGIGSQAKALKRLNVNFETYKVVEFDKYAINSYNAVHHTNFETSDITKIKAKDLEIVDTDKYEYIMTYSFPCQDLSLAGKGRGMKKGSSTRSGLLWEVERLLDEIVESKQELPQILLMENVPQVIGKKNIKDFQNWELKLESLGYSNYVAVLNSKDYGIPQNRNRCFMISILGEYSYTFPKKQKLLLRLKDMLEDEVDEKYYLSDKLIDYMYGVNSNNNFNRAEVFSRNLINANVKGIVATITCAAGQRPTDNFILVPEATKRGYAIAQEGDGVYLDRPHQKRGVVQKQMIQTLKTSGNDVGVVVYDDYNSKIRDDQDTIGTITTNIGNNAPRNGYKIIEKVVNDDTSNLKNQLCNQLIKDGKVKKYDVIRHSYSTSRMNGEMKDIQENNISPTLDTRCDCLGVVVENNMPKLIGGIGEKKSNGGTQFYQQDRIYSSDGVAMCHPANLPGGSYMYQLENLRIRKLTPKECWRLMGFDDKDVENASKVNSNAQLYKQAGNSIVVNVLEAIFKQLF